MKYHHNQYFRTGNVNLDTAVREFVLNELKLDKLYEDTDLINCSKMELRILISHVVIGYNYLQQIIKSLPDIKITRDNWAMVYNLLDTFDARNMSIDTQLIIDEEID
jgi:hypothetical protein